MAGGLTGWNTENAEKSYIPRDEARPALDRCSGVQPGRNGGERGPDGHLVQKAQQVQDMWLKGR